MGIPWNAHTQQTSQRGRGPCALPNQGRLPASPLAVHWLAESQLGSGLQAPAPEPTWPPASFTPGCRPTAVPSAPWHAPSRPPCLTSLHPPWVCQVQGHAMFPGFSEVASDSRACGLSQAPCRFTF